MFSDGVRSDVPLRLAGFDGDAPGLLAAPQHTGAPPGPWRPSAEQRGAAEQRGSPLYTGAAAEVRCVSRCRRHFSAACMESANIFEQSVPTAPNQMHRRARSRLLLRTNAHPLYTYGTRTIGASVAETRMLRARNRLKLPRPSRRVAPPSSTSSSSTRTNRR